MPRRPHTLADLRALGRDPLALFRADEALLVDGPWLARVASGAPLLYWSDEGEREPAKPYEVSGGVAVYDVEGPLAQRGWFCVQGYDTVARDLEAALADPGVRSVLLRINSPGGAAAGAFEWTRRMRALVAESGKRVVAYADEMAASGAYAVACVADEIVLPESGCVGSVGVIAGLVSEVKALADEGLDVRVLTSGSEKADGHPALAITDGAVARTQARVDELAAIFHRWVSERRGMTPEAVRALEAGVRHGAAAVSAGLADRVEGFHALHAAMRAEASPKLTQAPRAGAATTAQRTTMDPILTALNAETEADGLTAVRALVNLRTQLYVATGAATDDAALGALHAMKRDAASAAELRAKVEADAAARAKAERAALLDAAVASMRLTPAERAADGTPEAWTTALSNEALRAFAARAGAPPAPGQGPKQITKGAPSASALTDEQRLLAEQMGLDPAAFAAELAAQGD